jgi:Mrp family chromosome partitioning ATPase
MNVLPFGDGDLTRAVSHHGDIARRRPASAMHRLRGLMTVPTPPPSALAHLTAQAQQLAVDLFLYSREAGPLGVTSPLGGEGKTLLAAVIALSLSRASRKRTVLVEANWQRPTLSALFDLPDGPGLAEWLRGGCDETSIRRTVSEQLVVIPAGNPGDDELLLVDQLRDIGIAALAGPHDFVVVDLPSVLRTGAGRLAARLVKRSVVVARAGVTPLPAVVDTCAQLGDLAIQGVVLNQIERWIPRWLERIV